MIAIGSSFPAQCYVLFHIQSHDGLPISFSAEVQNYGSIWLGAK